MSSESDARITIFGSMSGESLDEIEARSFLELRKISSQKIVLDMIQVSYMDSRGISLCIRLFKEALSTGKSLSIQTNPTIFRFFSATNLTRVMSIEALSI